STFGEGSFDKGIRIVIPMEWALPLGTTTKFEEDLRPIQRDGGQPLDNDAELYDMTQSSSYGDLERQWPHVFQ
ncbi:MAG TPA: YjbH domain-containing protein, partial [Rhizomicrobium sp.]